MKSLQEQYNQIKIGKGSKEIFLKEAKALFPQYIPNPMGFDSAIVILKQRSVITENCEVKETVKPTNSFEKNFAKFLAEGKKKETEIKADLKKTDKSVEKVNDEANYDNEDTKTADNVIFDQYMRGIYTEMSKDPKQDLDTVKKKVLKNLTKDPLYYLKNGQFGVDGLGYTDELPGAKMSKSDQMVPLSKAKDKSNVSDTLGKKERAKGNPDKVKTMTTSTKNSRGVKKTPPPTKGKILKLKENQTLEDLMNEVDIDEGIDSRDPLFVQGYDAFYSADEKKNPYEGDEDTSKAEKWEDGWSEAERAAHDEADNDDLQEGNNYSEDEVSRIYDYHERTGMLPNDMDGSEFKSLCKKYNIGIDKDEDFTDPSGGSGLHSHLEEGPESQDDTEYIKRLATDLVRNAAFVSDTEVNTPEKLMSAYSGEDIEEFYKEIFGKLPLGNPATFSVNEGGDLNERLSNIIKKVMEGGMEDADATLAKQEADAEAKAAALSKQRADNKAKIAAANKNI